MNDLSLIGALPCFCGILALAVAERSLLGKEMEANGGHEVLRKSRTLIHFRV